MKECKSCGSKLIPIGSVMYHPDVKCEEGYGQLFNVTITILDEELYEIYKEQYGVATGDEYSELVEECNKLNSKLDEAINIYTEQAISLNRSVFIIALERIKKKITSLW